MKHHDLRPKLGLALGGGAARGWAHIGVLRTLQKAGIEPDIVAGTSIGALVGGCYLAGKLDDLELWARSLNRLRLATYLDFRVRQPGLIGGERLAKLMNRHLGEFRVETLPRPFATVATDLVTGHEVWLTEGPLVDMIRASFALPGVFPPMTLGQRLLIDGALVNPVPVSVCRARGAHMVIAVNLQGDVIGKAKAPGKNYQTVAGFDLLDLMTAQEQERGMAAGFGGLVKRVFRRDQDTPSIFGVMMSALGIILDRVTRSRLAGDPPDVHIAPLIGHVGMAEFGRAEELIAIGAAAAEAALPEIRAAMGVFGIPINGHGDTAAQPPATSPSMETKPARRNRLSPTSRLVRRRRKKDGAV